MPACPGWTITGASTGAQPLKAGRQNRAAGARSVDGGVRVLERLAGVHKPRSRKGCDIASVSIKRSSRVMHLHT